MIQLRSYAAADRDECVDAWHQASLIAHPFLDDAFLADERHRMATAWLHPTTTTVALAGDTGEGGASAPHVVGFLTTAPATRGDDGVAADAEIGGLFVHPQHQRLGVGHALVSHAARRHPVLDVEVFADNPIGHAFYLREGFVERGRTIEPQTGRATILMRRPAVPAGSQAGGG